MTKSELKKVEVDVELEEVDVDVAGAQLQEEPKEEPKEESITKEEQKLIEIARANKKREQEAQKALLEVLQKFNCNLIVDMRSPIGKPVIKLVLLQ